MPRLTVGMRARRGLTLPELLVAMILLAIVGGGVTRVMIKQQQYYKDARASATAKRELRLGATVLPSELRSISSSGGDILTMAEDQLEMRAYTGSSVICARDADRIWLPPKNLARHTLTTFVHTPDIGDTVFLYNENMLKGSEDDLWEKRWIVEKDLEPTACIGPPYTDAALDPGATKPRYEYRLNAAFPDSVKVGAVVRFTRPVRYKIYQESSGAWYLGLQEYSGAWGAASPLAGPYRAFASGDGNPSGLQLRYYDSLGVRITNMANKSQVARVDVFLRTNAGVSAISERKGNSIVDSVLMRVAIRNFK